MFSLYTLFTSSLMKTDRDYQVVDRQTDTAALICFTLQFDLMKQFN